MVTQSQREWRKRYIIALECNDYKQGVGMLKCPNGTYCALGVMCDISNLGNWVPRMKGDWVHRTRGGPIEPVYSSYIYLKHRADLPYQVKDLFGINDDLESALIGLNDFCLRSFKEIAFTLQKYGFLTE